MWRPFLDLPGLLVIETNANSIPAWRTERYFITAATCCNIEALNTCTFISNIINLEQRFPASAVCTTDTKELQPNGDGRE